MAEHKLAILIQAIGAAKAAKDLKGVDAAISNIGARAGKGLRTATSNMLKLGAAGAAVGAGIVAVNVKAGVQSLATLETAVTSVDAALRNMGYAGTVTGSQVATWANEIEAATQAAFDDKEITAATANLIRYGRVPMKNLRPAMQVMVDLAAKTGDVGTASKSLAKALADPTKATRVLRDAGVTLTKAQQKQLTAWTKAGKIGKAQALILELVGKNTKGAAAAMNGPWQDAMNTMNDAVEDAQKALAIGFMPVIKRAAEWINGVLADPATLGKIEGFGRSLAGAFDEALTFAQKIPWDAVGNGLKTAADWAKKLFDAFRSLPPEAQATIIALAGLDKLSGGAISGIVGELGKGLIKGVLGMTAGVVNINAAVVKGPGGVPTGGAPTKGVPTGALGGGGALATAGVVGGVAAVGAAAALGILYGSNALTGWKPGDEGASTKGKLGASNGLTTPILERMIGAQISRLLPPPAKPNATPGKNDQIGARQAAAAEKTERYTADTRSETIGVRKGVEATKDAQARSLVAFRDGERTSANGLSTVANTTRAGAATAAIASSNAASRIVGAVQANGRPLVNVYVNVPGASVRYGTGTGSAGRSANDGRGSGTGNDRGV